MITMLTSTILAIFASTALCLVIPPELPVLPALANTPGALETPQQPVSTSEDADEDPIPVIVWHGLGDSVLNDGLKSIADFIDEIHPGTYVHLISPVENPSSDKSATFFGNLTTQIDYVCTTLADDPILSAAPAVDALGFSQGGQFLRGYIERCGHWAPKVRNLLTFGSQHNGIAEFQKCNSPTDFVCQAANALLKSSTVWSHYIQSHLVPAQYYRNTDDFEQYLQSSNFLADVNNERKHKNVTYKENLAALENFVMVVFEDDQTVIPRESGWFAEVNVTDSRVTNLTERAIYKEDWIGLKQLDEKGGLVFESVRGGHMELHDKDLKRLFKRYLGPLHKNKDKSDKSEDMKQDVLRADMKLDL